MGPPLEKAFVHIELKPLTIQLTETSKGSALRLTRENNMIAFENVKTGLVTDLNKNIVACYRAQSAKFLPKTEAELVAITRESLQKLKSEGFISFEFETTAEEITRQQTKSEQQTKSDPTVPTWSRYWRSS